MLRCSGATARFSKKCTSTIIQQVEELKSLVNEFSQFARLPAARLTMQDLNEIVQESLFLFQEGHREIRFEFRRGEIPALELDRDLYEARPDEPAG